MEQIYRFSRTELLKYRHVPRFVSGESYLLVMASLKGKDHGQTRDADFALRAKNSRDGLEAFLFTESALREQKTDRDFYWTMTDEGNGTVSLWSLSAKKYLTMDDQGARLSKKKQAFTLETDGEFYRFFTTVNGETYYLRASGHAESRDGLIFTSGRPTASSTFACLERIRGLSAKPQGKAKLTVGSVADIHVDYGLQLYRPYLRKSAPDSAKTYRRRYDLDALITCGDNISDNGSGGYKYGGAMQGKWPRDQFLKTQKLLHETMQKSFRNPENQNNILWLTGNHDTQVGDRQPEGQRFNSGDYSPYYPEMTAKLTAPVPADEIDVGSNEHVLCYETWIKGVPFLVLNTPRYPLDGRARFPDRFAPAHTEAQAEWVKERLDAIEKEQGRNAVIFVSSHYPFWQWSYASEGPGCPDNRDAFLELYGALNRFPNLFYFYGHVHGGDRWIALTETNQNGETHSKLDVWKDESGKVTAKDSIDRGYFHSDLIVGTGIRHEFAGSLAFFKTSYFANDGVNSNSWLSEVEVPFFQGLVAEVYEDRVVLTMENLGSKAGVSDHIPNATYKLKPIVYPILK